VEFWDFHWVWFGASYFPTWKAAVLQS
jgi:hypothetical protein